MVLHGLGHTKDEVPAQILHRTLTEQGSTVFRGSGTISRRGPNFLDPGAEATVGVLAEVDESNVARYELCVKQDSDSHTIDSCEDICERIIDIRWYHRRADKLIFTVTCSDEIYSRRQRCASVDIVLRHTQSHITETDC